MRVNEKEEDSSDKALWDPLWEYILDDHDSIEEASLTRRKLLSRPARRQKETKNESSLFDLFFDNESDSSQESRYDYRDEKSSRSKDNKSSSKRRSQLTEDAGVDNSMWAFFSKESKVVQEKPPPTTVRATKLRTRQIIQTEDELQKTNKKSGLFRRFRKSKDPGAVTTDSKKQQVRVTVTQASAPASQASSMKKTQSQKQETIDPFQMFLEVAGRLDPFGSDDDSDSETATYDDATELYDLTASGAEMDRLVDEVRCGTPKNEILLNFKPTGNDFEEDQFESIEGREPMITDFGEKSLAESGAQAMSSTVDTISELGSTADEPREGVSKVSSTPSFRNFATDKREGPERQVEYPRLSHLDFRKKSATQRFGLKRLVCCSVKTHQHDVPPSILMGGKRETLPSIPITSDDASETQKIMGSNSNTSNNLMGVSSDQLVQSRGPQSFYAYEHDTQEHLDVFYTAMGLKPRSSLVVRKLGGPPPLIPSNMRDEVIVQVNASTISETDCIIRQGFWWGAERPPMANTPGVNVVGKVFQVKPQVELQHGLRISETVISLTKWGGNSRYVAIEPKKLVKVSNGIDPAEAACLPEIYLAAFQVLHLSQSAKMRYDRSSLRGKSILIVGSMANNTGKAIIELALHAGVANIYATAKQKHWKTLISFGVMPLSPEPLDWIARLEGTIDLVLASNGGLREDVTPIHFRALRPKTGRLIICGRRVVGNDVPVGDSEDTPTSLVCTKQKAITRMMNSSYAYDVFEQWEKNLELCKRDLEHLLGLLQQGVIQPKILDRVPLGKVMRAHELLESKRLSGFLVCEPWMKSKKRAIYL